jgi:hypothetical protein
MAGDLRHPPVLTRLGGIQAIALGGLALLLVLLIGGTMTLTVMTARPGPAQANLDSSGTARHDAVGCVSQGHLDRYYLDGENNRDVAPLLAGGDCRRITGGSRYSVVSPGLFVSRVLLSADGVRTPLYVTNASMR